ncbi:MAG: putative LPS assembly protein LptD [Rubricoccaceae bacterium]|nr:putative LPS assembly protein LptD [Rubricoccaceae bacterium]
MSPIRIVRIALLFGFCGAGAAAQAPADSAAADSTLADTGLQPIIQADTVLAPPAEGGLEQPVSYTARDSLRIIFADPDSTEDNQRPDDRAYLYGDVTARYESATLTAGLVELWFRSQELKAHTAETDSGRTQVPSFTDGEESFTGREFVYNLETRRGRVVGARTQIEDGYILGGIIKQRDAHVIYAADAAYTTCSLDHPHYALHTDRMKVVDGDWVYTGPVGLSILGIPMPVWLPFGFFPAAEGRRSGPLAMSYGEDRDAFGFYLENVGWYWAASDHFDALVRGKIGTRGSFQIDTRFNYVRRYAFDGSLDLSYARLRRGESLDPDFAVGETYRVRWNHSQTFTPNTRLSGSVDLTSNSQRFLSEQFDDRVSQTSTSSISFRQNWPRGGRSLSLDTRLTQQLSTGGAELTLPSLSFNQQRLFPLRRTRLAGRSEAWYEKIGISYSGSLTNSYSFTPLPDSTLADTPFSDVSWVNALFSQTDFQGATGREFRFTPRVQHSIPVNASFSMNAPFRLNWTPSVRYTEDWYSRFNEQSLDSTGTIVSTEVSGFTAIRRVNLGLSANTELYGTFPLRVGSLDGFRHIVRPQISFSYEPDYSAAPFNYFRTVADTTGQEVEYPIVAGIPGRRTQRLGFSLGNVFQTRLAQTDSTGETTRRVIQLFSLGLRSAYDFAAEIRPLSDVALDLTSQFNRYRLRLDATFSPYAVDDDGRLTEDYYFEESGIPLRTTRLNLSTGATFRSSASGGRPSGPPPGFDAPFNYDPAFPEYGTTPNGVVDYAIPWSLAVDFTYGFLPGFGNVEDQHSAVLSISNFDLSLTPNWKLSGRTGYDFERGELATTQISILRDLHCWEMRFNWIPFGDFRSFNFSIYVKGGHLRDLLRLDLPRSDAPSRFGNLF